MSWTRRVSLAVKALRELGVPQVSWYALYQLQLRSGYLCWRTRDEKRQSARPEAYFRLEPVLALPARQQLLDLMGQQGCREALADADEIAAGRVRLFGGEAVPLNLGSTLPQPHWSEIEKKGTASEREDIKWTWEPGRFGWAITLGRAYWLSTDERYPASFWRYAEAFHQANPPYQGVQWMSAQEAAFRLIALAFCAQAFARSAHSTPERMSALGRWIAAHAGRILPGMAYARAQNNNHLLSEAAGLYTAGSVLPAHPQSARWRKVGWSIFHQGLREQIFLDGSYVQHSTNYHRLMLQLACWMAAVARGRGEAFPEASRSRLESAVCWLSDLVDHHAGGAPNLGPNDGAYILPLAGGSTRDFRPALQAASLAFLGKPALPPGPWDEMGAWLSGDGQCAEEAACPDQPSGSTIRLERSWAYFRCARFTSRPGHADQLHVDLWWQGVNLALDPGSYLYNALPPWENVLRRTCYHNTVTVDGLDQMTSAGRFLWLDWAQASPARRETGPEGAWERLAAEHNGYRRIGVSHRRVLTAYQDAGGDRWVVEDTLEAAQPAPSAGKTYFIRLHWLLPDYPWEFQEAQSALVVETPHGSVKLSIHQRGGAAQSALHFSLVRAGEPLFGGESGDPARGWHAPGYGYKYPALSLAAAVEVTLPGVLVSEWQFNSRNR